jgi:hypothetical protein
MTDSHQGDCFEEFASELETPQAGDLADFAPEPSAEGPDGAVAPSPTAEHSVQQAWSRLPEPVLGQRPPSWTDPGIKTSGTAHRRHGIDSLLVAAGGGAVVTAACFAGYLLLSRTPARTVQPAPPVETARNDDRMPSTPAGDAVTDSVTRDRVTQEDGRTSTMASDEIQRQAEIRTGESPPATQPSNRQSEITSSETRGASAKSTAGSHGSTAQDERMAAPKQPTQPAQRNPSGGGPSENVTGWWTVTNEVQATSYERYRGLRLMYRLRLQQDGNRISGHGQKWAENGHPIPRASRTPIEVSGTIEGRRLVLTFTERGFRRVSGGAFELEVMEHGRLGGTFQSDAAQSQGTSVAQRAEGSQERQL